VTSLILSTTSTVLILIFKTQIAEFFTDHDEIISKLEQVYPIVTFLLCGDYMQGITGGAIRAMGFQKYASFICIVSYWAIGMPLSITFAFQLEYDVLGIWLGLPFGLTCVAISFLYMIYTTDFQELSQKIVDRLEKEKLEMNADNPEDKPLIDE